ncbi:MAG: sulfotransferase [Pseudomonadota bacterium]|nr:sulfotransferase [Pseudomonadota bacterium]
MATAREFVEALNRGDGAAAIAIAWQLYRDDAPLAEQWRGIARFAATRGEWDLAFAAMGRFVARGPDEPERLLAQAELQAEAGRLADAVTTLAPLDPDADPRVAHLIGVASTQLGELDAAASHLRIALRAWPTAGPAWLSLAAVHRFTNGEPLLAELERSLAAAVSTAAANRAPLFYAYGKALDDLGRHDAAFAAFSKGAALARGERPYNAGVDRQDAEALAAMPVASPATSAAAASRAIFVMGLPRSGTTLVEQILTSHSAVADGGEINLLAMAAAPARGMLPSQIAAHVAKAGEQGSPALNARYAHLLAQRFGGDGLIVDKSLGNTRFAGLIAGTMPAAPIVWLRRDPFDSAWSCFRTHFTTGLGWSFDLADIARHFAAEELLFRHWQATLGERMLVLAYADLVDAPEAWIGRILDHVGLPPQDGVFAFHTNRRAVTTSSVLQVRKPISGVGIGSAEPYRAHLQPFIDEYTRQIDRLG